MKKMMILLAVALISLASCKKEVIEPTVETVTVYETITEASQLQDSMIGNWLCRGAYIESMPNDDIGFISINHDATITSDTISWYGTELGYTVLSCDMIELDGQLRAVTFSADTMFLTSVGTVQHNSLVFLEQ